MTAYRQRLLATTLLVGAGVVATPASAQVATGQPGPATTSPPSTQSSNPQEAPGPDATAETPAAVQNSAQPSSDGDIVVTGTLIPRATTAETPSPITVLSQETLERRGITTVGEALQRLSANGSASLGEGWNNGNNFAAGATAPSLRGLTVQKTLSIFDGLRMAPYPFGDDGRRNFVDISTIPDNVVERIEILRDGASSTYGADAVAGVVNIITKKEIRGVHANVSLGESSRGDGREVRVDLSGGYGDLDEQGFNLYLAGTYRKNNVIWARDRGFPFNTGYYSDICNDDGACMRNPARWSTFAVNSDGTLGGSTVGLAPVVAPGTVTGARLGRYQLLNADCEAFDSTAVTLPASAAGSTWAPSQCTADLKALFQNIRPETKRYGLTARATVNIGEKAQAYVEGNFFHTDTATQQAPNGVPGQTTPSSDPLDPRVFSPTILPVYVCPQGVATIAPNGITTYSGCTDNLGNPINGAILNPNNPFAAQGQTALIRARLTEPTTIETTNRALRAAAGVQGTFGGSDEWNYSLDATASEVRVDRISGNYIIPQRMADVIATGEYNFVQPWTNSKEVLDYVAPTQKVRSTSDLWQVSGTLGRSLAELGGGPLAAAVGLSYRHEAINAPSGNPANPAHPFERYFTLNAVGAEGSRNVRSAYFEVNAPFAGFANNGFAAEVNVSGRYDKYSTGQQNFSPKIGVKVTPVRELALRGTWSKGFRIPSFNEAFGLPKTGYITLAVNCTTYAAWCASHGNNNYAKGQYQLGRTELGNPALDPEKSRSFTLGAVFEPMRNLSFTVDYWKIKVKGAIAGISGEDQNAVIDAYLRNGTTTGVIPGVILMPGAPDPEHPGATPLPAFISYPYVNANAENVSGIDFGMNFNRRFGRMRFSSSLEGSYTINYSVTRADGTLEKYAGTLSPCDYSSCSGTPRLRSTWQNTLDWGRATVTGTAYYTSGYDLASIDYGGVKGDCAASLGASVVTYTDGTPVKCKVRAQWNFDLTGSYKINDSLTLYGNVLNVFDIKPRFDPSAAYSIFNYNPIWGQPNIVGRYFRLGAKLDFGP
jgi:iron complex outermembrane receptor protein